MADPVPDLDLYSFLDECDEKLIQYLKEHLKLPCESAGCLPTSSNLNPEQQCNDREEVKFRVTQLTDSGWSTADIIDFAFFVAQQDRNMADKTIDVFNPAPVHEASTSMERESVMGFEDQPAVTMEGELTGKPEQKEGSPDAERRASTPTEEEDVVGIEDQVRQIKEWIMAETRKIDALSIVGMPGLGKTTLARKVFDDDYVKSYYDIRAFVSVSQVYQKEKLLLGILPSPHIQPTSDFTDEDLSEERSRYQRKRDLLLAILSSRHLSGISDLTAIDLNDELYKCLKGKRYLIVLDDIWDTKVWTTDLDGSFPDDNNRSRIMFTARNNIPAFHAQLNSRPHELRSLHQDESWDLLKKKVFRKESCPVELEGVGKQIAIKCAGLPLAIVVVAGVLLSKKEKTDEYWWKQVAESVSSSIKSDPKKYMDTLALSYHHLHDHLKPCFLYFGAFPEDYEIPVWKLIWLWVGEGLIEKRGEKNLEDEAEDYLKDLIERSLIIVANKRSDGGVKSCRIHDLLHHLCLTKAEEEGFLQRIHGYEQRSSSSSSSSSRLCIHSHPLDYISSKPLAPNIFSLLCFDSKWNDLGCEDTSFIYPAFEFLRVLDLWYIRIEIFPTQITELFHLKYLALRCNMGELPSELSNLSDLETFIVKGRKGEIKLPKTIWTLTKLRHLHITESAPLPSFLINGDSFQLNNLQTVSTLSFPGWTWFTLRNTPNLRKLGCILFPYDGNEFKFPNLKFLVKLETLKMLYHGNVFNRTHLSDQLPSNLKKMTLSKFRLPWSEMSKLGKLPKLEVLKLLHNAFEGPQWDTNDDEFPQLKFLKFDSLNISQWNAFSDHFPSLERLVLSRCKQLKEIPFSFVDISTLQIIELNWSSKSAEESVRQMEGEIKKMGNEGLLKVHIYPPDNS